MSEKQNNKTIQAILMVSNIISGALLCYYAWKYGVPIMRDIIDLASNS